jgi:hypothetical protein
VRDDNFMHNDNNSISRIAEILIPVVLHWQTSHLILTLPKLHTRVDFRWRMHQFAQEKSA